MISCSRKIVLLAGCLAAGLTWGSRPAEASQESPTLTDILARVTQPGAERLSSPGCELLWLDINLKDRTLTVRRCLEMVEQFRQIAIGRNGIHKVRQDDMKTPIGVYRIGWIDGNSQFHRFFGLNYPNTSDAILGYQRGLIAKDHLIKIRTATEKGAIPPQDTRLGGKIGIHGLGGRPKTRQLADWTFGCIALTNEQIDRLAQWVKEGTWVVIHP